ncbi:hypothetical protein K0M31_012130 [Melipona bicolor]|uniref:Uncharacterized protein n=1 Tax=Melipona bicolor TaxID=60889 RepID=A0AA40KVJ5_9HYME|nr:hypothetical protein K0M31_012130 [Melipona bicolor]
MDILTRPPDRTELPAIQERLIGNLSGRSDVLRPRHGCKFHQGGKRFDRCRQREIKRREKSDEKYENRGPAKRKSLQLTNGNWRGQGKDHLHGTTLSQVQTYTA